MQLVGIQIYNYVCIRGKATLQGPEQALSIPGVGGSNISRQSAHESGKVRTASPSPLDNIPTTH